MSIVPGALTWGSSQVAQSAGPQEVAWYQVVTGIIGVPTALITVYGAVLLSRKTRLETKKLELDIAKAESGKAESSGETQESAPHLLSPSRSPRAVAVSIEGYLIRFLLLYLTYSFVSLILGAISPLIAFSTYFVRDQPIVVQYVVGVSSAFFVLAGNLLVFLALGAPLLKDILASLGLTFGDLFSRKLRAEVGPRAQRQSESPGGPS